MESLILLVEVHCIDNPADFAKYLVIQNLRKHVLNHFKLVVLHPRAYLSFV